MPWPLCTSVLSMPSTSIWFERKPVPFTEFAVTPRMGVKDWLCTCDCAGTTPVERLSNDAKFRPFSGRSRTDWPVRRLPMVVVSVSSSVASAVTVTSCWLAPTCSDRFTMAR